MSRRVSKVVVVILALTLTLSAPSAFAARRSPVFDGPSGPIERIVEVVKKIVRGFVPGTSDDTPGVVLPTPPKP
jgi:hypothetical protein